MNKHLKQLAMHSTKNSIRADDRELSADQKNGLRSHDMHMTLAYLPRLKKLAASGLDNPAHAQLYNTYQDTMATRYLRSNNTLANSTLGSSFSSINSNNAANQSPAISNPSNAGALHYDWMYHSQFNSIPQSRFQQ